MNFCPSSDDLSINYHDVDHLGLSLPLDDEDPESEDERDEVFLNQFTSKDNQTDKLGTKTMDSS